MPAKDHAAWDIVTVLTGSPSRIKPVAAHEYRPLALDRTAFLNAGKDPALIREAYEKRTGGTAKMKPPITEVIGIVLLGIALLAVGFGLWHRGKPLHSPIYWMVCLSAVVTYTSDRSLRIMRRTINRFVERHCPDCNYDLSVSHADPPLDPQTLGINLGPRHCPECGALWPLVPPPDPASPTR